MMCILLHHPQNLLLQGYEMFLKTRQTKVQRLGYSSLDSSPRGALSTRNQLYITLHGRNPPKRLFFVRVVSDKTESNNSDDENSDEETSPNKGKEESCGLSRDELERIVGQDKSAFSGVDLASLIRNKNGRSYDVQLIKKKCRNDKNKLPLLHPSAWLKYTAVAYCLYQVLVTPSISHSAAANMKAVSILSESIQILVSSHTQSLIMADLDPQTAKLLVTVTGPFLSAFGLLFILRIVMSWYPKLPVGKLPYIIAYAPTEPLLVITRKVIPPLGGVDVTPVVWFGVVSFLNEILVGPQGILVLLSRQV